MGFTEYHIVIIPKFPLRIRITDHIMTSLVSLQPAPASVVWPVAALADLGDALPQRLPPGTPVADRPGAPEGRLGAGHLRSVGRRPARSCCGVWGGDGDQDDLTGS